MRVERGFALLATLYANRNSTANTQFTIYDFMQHEDEPGLSIEEAMANWS